MKNILPQPSARLWYHSRNYGEAEGEDTQDTENTSPDAALSATDAPKPRRGDSQSGGEILESGPLVALHRPPQGL